MAEPAQAAARRGTDARTKRTIALLALIAIAPVVAAYAAYYIFPRDARVNYGALIAKPAPPIAGERIDGGRFALADLRGRWVLLIAGGSTCEARCERMLYATRQARTMQGREMDRVVRAVVLTGNDAPPQGLLEQHPGLVVARADAPALAQLPAAADAIYLVDPLGNLVLQYADDPDVKRLAKDLERVLKASSIG